MNWIQNLSQQEEQMMDCVKRYIEAIIKNLDRTFKCVLNIALPLDTCAV